MSYTGAQITEQTHHKVIYRTILIEVKCVCSASAVHIDFSHSMYNDMPKVEVQILSIREKTNIQFPKFIAYILETHEIIDGKYFSIKYIATYTILYMIRFVYINLYNTEPCIIMSTQSVIYII